MIATQDDVPVFVDAIMVRISDGQVTGGPVRAAGSGPGQPAMMATRVARSLGRADSALWIRGAVEQGSVKTYRPGASLVLMLILSLCFLLVGVSMLSVDTGVASAVFAAVWLAFSVFLGSLALTERLAVTARGVEFRHNFRRTAISWSAIRGFDIGISRSMVRWPCLIINSDSGPVSVGCIAGSRSFVNRVAAELRNFKVECSQ
jgi:hypothetical protein